MEYSFLKFLKIFKIYLKLKYNYIIKKNEFFLNRFLKKKYVSVSKI